MVVNFYIYSVTLSNKSLLSLFVALKQYYIHNVPEVTKQCSQRELIPSLLFNDCEINFNNKHLLDCFNVSSKSMGIDLASVDIPEQEDCNTNSTLVEVKSEENVSEDNLKVLINELKEIKSKYKHLQEDVNSCKMALEQVSYDVIYVLLLCS